MLDCYSDLKCIETVFAHCQFIGVCSIRRNNSIRPCPFRLPRPPRIFWPHPWLKSQCDPSQKASPIKWTQTPFGITGFEFTISDK